MRQAIQTALMVLFGGACVMVAVLALGPPPEGLAPDEDKVLHFLAFLMLTVLGAAAFPRNGPFTPAAGLLGGGVAIELLQGLPAINRSMSLGDVAADAAGIVAGLILVGAAMLIWTGIRRLTL